jgi:cyclohexyl-isocyanide hydratase
MHDGATRVDIGFLVFANLTQLDFTAPYEVLARLPGAVIHIVGRTLDPIRSEHGLQFLPTTTIADCPPLDVICIPGGRGVNATLVDAEVLAFVRRMAASARFVTSVCTGSLLLGAAGLLRGRRATCHWMSRELLTAFGAAPVDERIVIDGNLITGGGVTAGLDFALRVVAELAGRATAEAIQLSIEYDPAPPFDAGSPRRASAAVVQSVRQRSEEALRERRVLVERAAALLA